MIKLDRLTALAAGVAIAAASIGGVAASPVLQVHRTAVTETGPDGKFPARSTGGHFSIVSPFPFNDYTMSLDDPPNGKLVQHVIASKSRDGLELSAIETERHTSAPDPDLREIVSNLAKAQGGAAADVVVTRAGDEEIALAELTAPVRNVVMRISKTPTSLFNVVCSYPASKGDAARQTCKKSMQSFQVIP